MGLSCSRRMHQPAGGGSGHGVDLLVHRGQVSAVWLILELSARYQLKNKTARGHLDHSYKGPVRP